MLLQIPIDTLPPIYWIISFLVTLLASNAVTAIIVHFLTRPKTAAEIHESRARTDLATIQTTKTLAETLHEVSEQLRDSYDLVEHQQGYIELLELQLARARAQGFVNELDNGAKKFGAGGSGNPAALPPAS